MSDQQEPEQTSEDAREPRRYPSTIGGAGYLVVLAVALLGLLLIGVGVDWRIGIRVIAAALGLAGVLRLVLPDRDAGMLAVRNRWQDAAVVIVVGVALLVLSIAIPDQPL